MRLHRVVMNRALQQVCERSNVSDARVEGHQALVAKGGGKVPGLKNYNATIEVRDGHATFTLGRREESMVLCQLVWDKELAEDAWAKIEGMHMAFAEAMSRFSIVPDELMQQPDMPESLPWLATLLMPNAILSTSLQDLRAVTDVEEWIAWAILDSNAPAVE